MHPSVRILSLCLAALAALSTYSFTVAADTSEPSKTKLKGSFWGIADTGSATAAVSTGGTAAVSTEPKKWQINRVKGASLLLSISTAGNGALVAVGGDKFTSQRGSIFRSTDSGRSFSLISRAPAPLYEVKFRTPDHGLSVGANGTILSTTDGGRKWNQIQSGTKTNLWAAHFISDKVWLVGGGDTPWQNQDRSSGEIRRTTDAGKTWTGVHKGDKRISDFAFIDKKIGYAAGVGGTVLRTGDGGATWTKLPNAPLRAIVNAIEFVSETCGIAVGSGGTAYVTTDGAQSWRHKIAITKGSFLEDLTPQAERPGAFWTVAGDGTIASIDISRFCAP